MNLCLDIGNTRAKIGLFDGSQLLQFWSIPRTKIMEFPKTLTNHSIKNVILSTVAQDVGNEIRQMWGDPINFIELNEKTALPIQNTYRTPETLGKDRIAAVVGATLVGPATNKLIVDAGTCITFELLKDNEVYLGGNISPGVKMRLQAMHHFTARLPVLSMGETEAAHGYDTPSAMRNGAQWGTIWEIEGTIDHFAEQFDPLTVILTGGDANFLAEKMKRKIFVHQHLVLLGLNKILDYNVE
mgnify:CR=1 FL=1